MAAPTAPGKSRMLWWGFTKRCPRCGSGHLFHGWFNIVDQCPRCGLHFDRERARHWIGLGADVSPTVRSLLERPEPAPAAPAASPAASA